MAKLTINDKDYYTDDFNAEQSAMHKEIIVAQAEIGRMDYLTKVLQARCSMLGGMIVEIAEQEEPDETETSA